LDHTTVPVPSAQCTIVHVPTVHPPTITSPVVLAGTAVAVGVDEHGTRQCVISMPPVIQPGTAVAAPAATMQRPEALG
jgi:hypothetical protein